MYVLNLVPLAIRLRVAHDALDVPIVDAPTADAITLDALIINALTTS